MELYAFWLHPCSLHAQQGTNKSLNKTTPPIFSFSRGVCYSSPTLLCARDLSVKAQGDPISRSVSDEAKGLSRDVDCHWITLDETSAPLSLWWTRLCSFPLASERRARPTISPHLFASFGLSGELFVQVLVRRLVIIIGTMTLSKLQDLWRVLRYFQLDFWWIIYTCIEILLRVLNFEFEIIFVIYIYSLPFCKLFATGFGEFNTKNIYRILFAHIFGESIESNCWFVTYSRESTRNRWCS